MASQPGSSSLFLLALCLASAAALALEPPQPVSPGQTRQMIRIASPCPTFSWAAGLEVEAVELVVYALDGPQEGLAPEGLREVIRRQLPGSALSWTPAVAECLEPGGRYAWSLRGLGATEAGEWSQVALFHVSSVPSAEELQRALEVLRRYLDNDDGRTFPGTPGARLRQRLMARDASPEGRERRKPESEAELDGSARTMERSGKARPARGPTVQGAGGDESARLESLTASAAAPTLGSPSLSLDGDVSLSATSNLFKDGAVLLWDGGADGNLATGRQALSSNTTGTANTAHGYKALSSNSTGNHNTAVGHLALASNIEGSRNTATGSRALWLNKGESNTATGYNALASNNTGNVNVALGSGALRSNTTGLGNTAAGAYALYYNSTSRYNTAVGSMTLLYNNGKANTASGYSALFANTSGYANTATGVMALQSATTANYNTAVGYQTLYSATTGGGNTAVGALALSSTTGSGNIALGYRAGYNLGYDLSSPTTSLSDNIHIGNQGEADEEHTIRIGTYPPHTRTFIAGIYGVQLSGSYHAVYVDSYGQLGKRPPLPSSRRFKKDIRDMGMASSPVLELRPVTFRFNKDPSGNTGGREEAAKSESPLEYGLIAEEVAEVFPELVVYDEDGKPFSVRYSLLSRLLLNELQKQNRMIADQRRDLDRLRARLEHLERLEAR